MNLPAINPKTAKLPQTYVAARNALEKCQRIDECKQWKDKMEALASYARQTNDKALLKMASEIKKRAIRRGGQLLEKIKASKGGRPPKKTRVAAHPSSRKKAAKQAGFSEHQKKTALKVAKVPEAEFEAAVADETESLEQLAARGTNKKAPPQPAPYRNEFLDWTGAVRKLRDIPACGLDILASRSPGQQDDLLQEVKAALRNLTEWQTALESANVKEG